MTEEALISGKAFEKFKEWISSQGGNSLWLENTELFPKAKYSYEIKSEYDGYITKTDAEKIGIASVILGAGRETKEDAVDMGAGIILRKKTGDKVQKGDTLAILCSDRESAFAPSESKYLSALEFSKEKPKDLPLIYRIIN